ncbi:MAG: AAA family ATPase [Candidatus Kerfeldbacteria bacterium]|nr:AAA family ATPase [Candidatus Kerfeldbacteria bacterium]
MTNAGSHEKNVVFACPACGGRGADTKSSAECHECKGRGHYVFFNGRFLYWGLPLSDAAIYSARLQRLLAILLKGILIFVGVLGLISFLFELIVQVPRGLSLTALLETQNPRMLVFWISVVVDMLILYYFDQELSSRSGIRVRLPKKLPPTGDHPTYRDIEKLHAKWKDDISRHFADDAIRSIEQSWFLARTWQHGEVQPIHLLYGLLNSEDVQMMLLRSGIARRTVEEKIKTILSEMEKSDKKSVRLSVTVRALFFEAYTFAYGERKKKVGGRDMLRGLARLAGPVRDVLEDVDLSVEKVDNIAAWITASDHLRREYREYRQKAVLKPKGIMNRALTARPTPLLDAVSMDWTLAARASSFFPLVDRADEMIELFRGLEQRGGNVLLVGEVGVGKRAIVRGLADRMVTEDVPEFLQDKRLVALNTSVLLSIVGKNVEAKLLQIVSEVSSAGNIVLFIEDIAELVGAGGTGSRTLDASGVLAQALTSRGVDIIASASTEDFAHNLQDNPSFLRHFHVIHVNEVETNVAIQVLEAQSLMIEAEHRVMFSYDAIESAVKLSDQYIHDAFLPEKAISIAEESAALAKEKRGSPALVLKADVQEVISRRTNVRVTDVAHAEADVLLHLEEKIHERIVGQDEAVRVVAEAIRRARMKMRDENRPIVNLMFLGPTRQNRARQNRCRRVFWCRDEHDSY